MGLISEWKVFGSLAVDVLGMPADAMPFYDNRYVIKGERVLERVLRCGNFGHNNDLSYREKYEGMIYNLVSLWRRFLDFFNAFLIFPVDSPKFFSTYVFNKVFK